MLSGTCGILVGRLSVLNTILIEGGVLVSRIIYCIHCKKIRLLLSRKEYSQ